MRTGDGRPGPLDPRDTSPGCDACSLERYLYESNARLHRRLQKLGIRHIWDDYGPGTHDWPYWRRALRETLPALERAFAGSDRGTATRTAIERDAPCERGAGRCTIPRTSSSAKAKKGAPP